MPKAAREYFRTTDEMLEEFSYLGADRAREVVITNTNAIADSIDDGILPVPKGKFPPHIDGAEETLRKACAEKLHEIYGDNVDPKIQERLDKELNSIIGNGYAVMYVSAQMLVNKSLSDGYLVGLTRFGRILFCGNYGGYYRGKPSASSLCLP